MSKIAPFHSISQLFKLNYPDDDRYNLYINQGGTSSSKTYSILQVIAMYSCVNGGKIITVVGQDIPNLKVGAIRDFAEIVSENDFIRNRVVDYNRTDRVYRFNTGSIVEFRSYGNSQDAKSGKRDGLFINEADGIGYDIYEELAVRTSGAIWIDYNPTQVFWVHKNLLKKPGVRFIKSTFEHNPFLDERVRAKILAYKDTDEWRWKVYGLGEVGVLEGAVFTNWEICSKFPEECKWIAYGQDFGFTNDPSTLIRVGLKSGELYVQELMYETGLTNMDISAKYEEFELARNAEIIADSAEQKSIQELNVFGWNVFEAIKGKGSIILGIDVLKRYKINITAGSKNIINEFNNYAWKKGRDGEYQNTPIDNFNHAIDAIRYVALNKIYHPVKSWVDEI